MKMMFFIMGMTKGGAERVTSNLVNYYASDDGNRVALITCITGKNEYEIDSCVERYSLDSRGEERYERRVKRFARRRRVLKKLVDCLRPELMIVFLPEPCFLALSIRNKTDARMIISERSDPATIYGKFYYRLLVNIFYARADGFVLQTRGAKKWFRERIVRNAAVIPNPVSGQFLKNGARSPGAHEILAVGSLTPPKNYHMLIRAIENIGDGLGDWRVTVYGEGEQRDVLEREVAEKRLEETITFAGNTDALQDAYFRAGIYVMTSDFEGMPNALLEAMVMGTPCISTDCPCGGPGELIQDGVNGILVPVGDDKRLAEAILRLIHDPEYAEKLGREAEKIRERVSPEAVFAEWDSYIEAVMETQRGSRWRTF